MERTSRTIYKDCVGIFWTYLTIKHSIYSFSGAFSSSVIGLFCCSASFSGSWGALRQHLIKAKTAAIISRSPVTSKIISGIFLSSTWLGSKASVSKVLTSSKISVMGPSSFLGPPFGRKFSGEFFFEGPSFPKGPLTTFLTPQKSVFLRGSV